MPKTPEPREEDRAKPESLVASVIKQIQKPDRGSLAANTQLSSVLAIPMAEEDTIGIECMAIINHQIDKASSYKETLPTKIGYARATIELGVITAVNIKSYGSGYKQVPDVIITDIQGNGAEIIAEIGMITTSKFLYWNVGRRWIVKRLIIKNGGRDYTQDAKIEIKGSEGIGAKAELEITGVLDKVIIEDRGVGYKSAPIIMVEGGGGTGANVVARVNHSGQLEEITILRGGRGYKTAPSVVIDEETQEIYNERLEAFKKSVHLLSDELLHAIRMNNLSIDGANMDNVKDIGLGLLQNIGQGTGQSEPL